MAEGWSRGTKTDDGYNPRNSAMFMDEAEIEVAAGKGGDGVVHFRREKYVPRGGPDGGDGGRGGHVVLRVRATLHGLNWYREKHRFTAEAGRNGGSSNKSGRHGRDLILPVPPGTLVRLLPEGDVLADLTEPRSELLVARGGRGGRGNARFATARRQTPRLAERGEPGQTSRLRLEVRLLADIGIVGAPNAGKSTLLAALTQARPKIGDYPFTTLQPNLGVAELDGRTIVLADIPGLIEGAHAGAGLGDRFLRHIRRTRALIHLLDGAAADPLADMEATNAELSAYDASLARTPQVVALNKIDRPEVAARWPEWKAALERRGLRPLSISALNGAQVDELLRQAAAALREVRPEMDEAPLPIHRPAADDGFAVARDPDGSWRISGRSVERAAAMTYWEHDEGVRRFQRSLERMGVEDALRKAGVRPGETVRIGEYELEWEE
jgi:GTP-binding protein